MSSERRCNTIEMRELRHVTVTGVWLISLLTHAQANTQAFQDILDRKTTGKVIIEPWR